MAFALPPSAGQLAGVLSSARWYAGCLRLSMPPVALTRPGINNNGADAQIGSGRSKERSAVDGGRDGHRAAWTGDGPSHGDSYLGCVRLRCQAATAVRHGA